MDNQKYISIFLTIFLLLSPLSFAEFDAAGNIGTGAPVPCPQVLCVALPAGCEYMDEVDDRGCPTCGRLVCKDPEPCPLLDCVAPPEGCEYVRDSDDCLTCGRIVCGHDLNSCEDSDGGINYYEAGVVEWSVQDFRVEDICGDDTTLFEYYCKKDQYHKKIYDCPQGCEDGECVEPEPCVCPEYYDPVCGSNGETYSNECFAKCEVKKWKDGPCTKNICEQEVEGEGPCDAYFVGYEYNEEKNKCVEQGVSGCSYETPFKTLRECTKKCVEPEACPKVYDPVCGQPPFDCPPNKICAQVMPEPVTYGNECKLKRAGAEWLYDGKCRKKPVCGNNVCEKGEANDPRGCGKDAPPECLGPPARQGTCPKDCEQDEHCATYVRGDSKEEICTICGDGLCEKWEKCTPSSCTADGACTRDCGGLYCPQDCKTRDECLSDKDCPPINCFTEPCPINKCVKGDCVLVEEHKPECRTDRDCPQITCITSPCPQLKCLRGECVQDSCGDGVCSRDEVFCKKVCDCPSEVKPILVEEVTVADLGSDAAGGSSRSSDGCVCKEICEFGCPQDCSPKKGCVDQCGDGLCQEIVCLGTNCPCGESARSCPQDCVRKVRNPEDLHERPVNDDDKGKARKEYQEALQRFNRAKDDLVEKRKKFLEAKRAGNKKDETQHGKDTLLHVSDMMVSHLEKIKARLQENGHIKEDVLKRSLVRLDTKIDRIQKLQTGANTVEDASQVRDVAKDLKAEWEVAKKDAKVNAQRVISGKVKDIVNKGRIMEKRLNKALDSGNLNAATSKKIDEFSAHIQSAKKKQGLANELLEQAEKADTKKAIVLANEAKELLQQAKKELSLAHRSLKEVSDTSSDIMVNDEAVELDG